MRKWLGFLAASLLAGVCLAAYVETRTMTRILSTNGVVDDVTWRKEMGGTP
jgi:hypothetical protein